MLSIKPLHLLTVCLSCALSTITLANQTTHTELTMPSFDVIETNIKQSPNDQREYQVIRLSNHLEVLLVSDPDLENSSASLAVPIGSMHNPEQQLGLAHYLEHMLFLGSERYPTINEYSKFMSQHGGYTNAYTSQDSTVYGFEVNDDFLGEALDRLGDVMRAPLLDEKYAEKERHTVNAEHKTYYDNDMRKLYALQRYTLNPEHPMTRFSTGDLTTLVDKENSKLQDELQLFFERYYSANLMKVAITSPRSIEQLQKIANLYLTQIPNKQVSKPVILTPLLNSDSTARKISMIPTADIKLLQVNFLLPSVKTEYMYQPGGYLTRLLGSDHQGGLSDTLQKLGLVESVMAGFYATHSDQYSQLSMQFKLTKDGVDEQDTILVNLFAFIDLIKKQGVNELQYEQQKQSLSRRFEFLSKRSGFNYVMALSANMQNYPYQDILFYPYRLDQFNAEFIKQLLTYLTPENSRIFELSPKAQGDRQIPFYKGEYAVQQLSLETQQEWLTAAANVSLVLPKSNDWIAEDLSIVEDEKTQLAKQLVNKKGHSVWFQQSQYLQEPKAMLKLQLNNDIADQSAKNRVRMSLFINMLNKHFAELNFMTNEAGLSFSVNSNNGLLISTAGYSDKQDKLLLTVLSEIKEAKFSEQSLTMAKEELLRRLNNKAKSKVMDLALSGFRDVIRKPAWSDATLKKSVDSITLVDIDSFVKQLFSSSSMRLLALGNLRSKQVLALSKQIEQAMIVQKQPFYIISRLHANLKQGALNYHIASPKQDDALASLYLTNFQGNKALATAELLNKLLRPAFYDQIRTQEQLTYSPFSASFAVNERVAFGLFTQTPAISNAQLYGRFDAFLNNFNDKLKDINSEKFNTIKQAHIANYVAKPDDISAEFAYLIGEWSSIKDEINNKSHYIETLKGITLQDVRSFYKKVFLQGKNRQEIIVQVQGTKFKEMPLLTLQDQVEVKDIDALPKQ